MKKTEEKFLKLSIIYGDEENCAIHSKANNLTNADTLMMLDALINVIFDNRGKISKKEVGSAVLAAIVTNKHLSEDFIVS